MAHGLKRKLDYSDLQAIPPDGKRYELARGELLVSPAPSPAHQRVSLQLARQLQDYFEDRSIGTVFCAPLDVILTRHDVFEPDLLVAAEPSHITKRGIEGPPLLAVEILSPSSRSVDRGLKARRYAELGIAHYWIVDPDEKRIECFRLERGIFKSIVDARGDALLSHPGWDGLTIELVKLWR